MKQRLRIVLALLARFDEQSRAEGRREISLSEILEGAQEVQKSVDIGYNFAKEILYSRALFRDIALLRRQGYLEEYRYIHDSFLPKSFIRLTQLGKAEGRSAAVTLASEFRERINRSVALAKEQANQRWRLFSRAAHGRSFDSPWPARPISSQPFLSAGHRARELAWRLAHQEALRQYEGQWVVLEGETIIAHGPDLATAVAEARSRGVATPYVFYAQAEEQGKITLGL